MIRCNRSDVSFFLAAIDFDHAMYHKTGRRGRLKIDSHLRATCVSQWVESPMTFLVGSSTRNEYARLWKNYGDIFLKVDNFHGSHRIWKNRCDVVKTEGINRKPVVRERQTVGKDS